MRKLLSLIVMLVMSVTMLLAQNKTITGVVTSAEDGEPVIGASIVVPGTGVGTVTDINGQFSLSIPENAKTIRVSYVGMSTQDVKVSSKMNITLSSDDEVLEEVMVVAYGTSKKSSFTGSASSVNSKKMELRPITSATKALEGQTTGVLTTSGSGQPGESGKIVIRGFGSINASQDPLYVVDGIPFSGNISSINPSDIESMTVLKDASAGALYGARGANGVVMITTKKGKEGKAKVMWRSTLGWSDRAIPAYEMVNQRENVELVYEAERNAYFDTGEMTWAEAEEAGRNELFYDYGESEFYNPFKNYTWDTIIDPATGKVRADAVSAWNEPWLDAVLRRGAFRHEHQLSINGGTEKTHYMYSLGYLNEDGILDYTNFQRYNARANVDSQIKDWFSGNLNISASHSIQNYQQFSGTANSNVWYTAQFANPLFPVYMKDAKGNDLLDSNGNRQLDYGTEYGRFGSNSDLNPLGGVINDVSDIKGDVASIRTGLVLGGDSDKLGAIKGLKLSVNFGVDYRSRNQMLYYNMYHGNQANANGLIYRRNNRTVSYTFNQLLTWNRSFGKHNIDLLAGHEFYAYEYQYLTASKTNLVEGIYELYPATTLSGADSYSNKHRIESWLGRANYSFNDKYYASASLRRDGSSRFNKDARWGTFWSLGGSWRISKESFMENISWLDNLSLRASYGEQGNESLSDYYAWQALYDVSYANGNNVGALAQSLENKDISWEKNGNFNVGLDFSVFNNRLGGSIEYYNKSTKDMLLDYPMALSTGFASYNANVGDMYNRGLEIEVHGTPIRTKDWTWNLTVMASTTKNKVTKLTNASPQIVKGVRVIEEGYPVYTFYMAQAAGVDPETGKQLYWVWDTDDNGSKGEPYKSDDYSKAANCKEYLGSRIPDLYGSINTDITWKNLTLSALTTYSIGGKIYDSNYAAIMNLSYLSSNWHKDMLARWQKPGDITDVPRVEIAGKYTTTDRFLKSASYFAIKNITLSYNLPKSWMRKAGMESVRIFGSADNLALFSSMKGMDPQYDFTGGTDYSYSPNKTYSLGIEVNF